MVECLPVRREADQRLLDCRRRRHRRRWRCYLHHARHQEEFALHIITSVRQNVCNNRKTLKVTFLFLNAG